MTRYEQYLVCLERGHTKDPMRGGYSNAVHGALTWYTCKYCFTGFATVVTTTVHEKGAPEKDEDS